MKLTLRRDSYLRQMVEADAKRQIKEENFSEWEVFKLLMRNYNFQRIFIYRCDKYPIIRKTWKLLLKPNWSIELNAPKIGGGLVVYHNMGAVVSGDSIGKNATISQGVVIGYGGAGKGNVGRPTVGDNVRIGSNAIVIGAIHIGDNAIIGAGAVVTKDVPRGAVVVGNPQRILKINLDDETNDDKSKL
jgi:serine acetyltransferase